MLKGAAGLRPAARGKRSIVVLLAAEITPTITAAVTPAVAVTAEATAGSLGIIELVVQALVAIGTLALAAATFKMVRANQRMVKEMERQRLDAVHPDLVICQTRKPSRQATIDFREVLVYEETVHVGGSIEIHNFGTGLARGISLNFEADNAMALEYGIEISPLASQFWTVVNLSPIQTELGKKYTSGYPKQATLELSYRDTFDCRHRTIIQLALKEPEISVYSVKNFRHECSNPEGMIKEAIAQVVSGRHLSQEEDAAR